MKAAQTGHLVLSNPHTNDSISAVVRLLIWESRLSDRVFGEPASWAALVRKLLRLPTLEPNNA